MLIVDWHRLNDHARPNNSLTPKQHVTTPFTYQSSNIQQSGMAEISLLFLIEGESSTYSVRIPTDETIPRLQALIKERRTKGAISGFDAGELILWKVRMIMGQRYHN